MTRARHGFVTGPTKRAARGVGGVLTLFSPERTQPLRHSTAMTLESRILQQLGAGPIRQLMLEGVDADELATTLGHMAARRQICIRPDQISLYWHRHMILSPMTALVRKVTARPVAA